ncbi:MAG: hypothetical protein BWX47_02124 [candidate division Hyd24-12 bacterium ADurb.Bin004]|nr:MAG: hypothetical protein BWX47_02124 [candidate division Hyd24-12 bacterium ADurb.Bin004]
MPEELSVQTEPPLVLSKTPCPMIGAYSVPDDQTAGA